MKSFQDLLAIARKLRSRKGCPWDRQQTIESMLPHLESEVTEIRQAVQKKDWGNLKEELGDTLFNIIMITQIASEEKKFGMNDVLRNVTRKIKSRHTWVFGSDRGKVKTAEDALALWQENKARQRKK